jgi:hypothetical protein
MSKNQDLDKLLPSSKFEDEEIGQGMPEN